MDASDNHQQSPPLFPIGFLVMVMLTIPVWLYSTSPEGPVKEGDVVFSTGRHHAYFREPSQFQRLGYENFCILEPRERLIVLQLATHRKDGTLAAKILGDTLREFPFCPPHAEIFLKPHQASLKVDVWEGFKDILSNLFPTE